MSALLPPAIKFQPLINGTILPGGKVWTYRAGTSTPQATYQSDGVTPNTNPIILDSNGSCDLRLDRGLAYKVNVLDSADVQQAGWPIDGVTALAYPDEICQGRLTLASGTPITTTDQLAKTTLYFPPYKGNKIALYDSYPPGWRTFTFSELSISLAGLAANTNYDVFVTTSAGVAVLALSAWATDTSRATALVLQDGILVQQYNTSRRYVGTIRTTGTTGQCEDSAANRYVWNYYNRAGRPMRVSDATASWNYTTATWRQMNGSAANQANFVIGVVEDPVKATHRVSFSNSTASTGAYAQCGIGLNSTSAVATGSCSGIGYEATSGGAVRIQAEMASYPALGKNYVAPLELSGAVGTTTWGGGSESGLLGEVLG